MEHDLLIVDEDTVELPNGKQTNYIYTPSTHDSVIIIATNEHNELLMQREYSHPPHETLWQLPGGSLTTGESVLEAAQRELSEESGCAFKEGIVLGYFYANNRHSNKKQFVVACSNLCANKLPEDEDEFIESYWIPVKQVHHMIQTGKFTNINLLAALNMWFHQPGSTAS